MKKRMSVVLSMALVMGIMGQCAIAVNAASKTDDDTLNITLLTRDLVSHILLLTRIASKKQKKI